VLTRETNMEEVNKQGAVGNAKKGILMMGKGG